MLATQATREVVDALIADRNVVGYVKEWVYYPSVANMLVNLVRRKRGAFSTFTSYFRGVKRFVEYLQVEHPEQAIATLPEGNATDVLDGFIESLTKTDLSPKTIKRLYYGVRKWLSVNDIAVDWDRIEIPRVGSQTDDRIPTDDELRHVWNFMRVRDKAMFSLLLSSGLRVGTLITLQLKDLDLESHPDIGLVKVQGGEGRKLAEGSSYFTFINTEAKDALRAYLNLRREQGEDLTEDSYVVAIRRGRSYQFSHNVSRRWRTLLRRVGLTEKTSSGLMELHLHVLRKRFQTLCKTSGVSSSFYDLWMGHMTKNYLDEAYFRAELPQHKAEYRKVMNVLRISVTAQVNALSSIERMVRDLAKMRRIPQAWLVFPRVPDANRYDDLEDIDEAEEREAERRDRGEPMISILRTHISSPRNIPDEKKGEVKSFVYFLNTFLYGVPPEEDAEPLQRVIEEGELPGYLGAGWKFVNQLNGGQCVVERIR